MLPHASAELAQRILPYMQLKRVYAGPSTPERDKLPWQTWQRGNLSRYY